MPGLIKKMIEHIVVQKAGDDPAIKSLTRAKIIMKGVNPTKFSDLSEDDPLVISKLKQIACDFGINDLESGGW